MGLLQGGQQPGDSLEHGREGQHGELRGHVRAQQRAGEQLLLGRQACSLRVAPCRGEQPVLGSCRGRRWGGGWGSDGRVAVRGGAAGVARTLWDGRGGCLHHAPRSECSLDDLDQRVADRRTLSGRRPACMQGRGHTVSMPVRHKRGCRNGVAFRGGRADGRERERRPRLPTAGGTYNGHPISSRDLSISETRRVLRSARVRRAPTTSTASLGLMPLGKRRGSGGIGGVLAAPTSGCVDDAVSTSCFPICGARRSIGRTFRRTSQDVSPSSKQMRKPFLWCCDGRPGHAPHARGRRVRRRGLRAGRARSRT
jgi:hypothetical protein